MKTISAMKYLVLAGGIVLSTSAGAQSILRMDNASCTDGLDALADVVKLQIMPASSPRKVVGKCDAQPVRVTSERAGVILDIKRVTWNRNGLAPLADGQLPKQLRLELRGVKVTKAPAGNPVWAYLVDYTKSGRQFDAKLAFAFNPGTGVLELTGASVDFHNGNTARLSAKLHGVVPAFPQNPEMGIFPLIIDEVALTINSRGSRKNPLLDLGIAILKAKIPNGDIKEFKVQAVTSIIKELETVLGANGLDDARKLVAELPRPSGDIMLRMTAAKGYPALRLGVLRKESKPSEILDGVSVEFEYGPDLFDDVN